MGRAVGPVDEPTLPPGSAAHSSLLAGGPFYSGRLPTHAKVYREYNRHAAEAILEHAVQAIGVLLAVREHAEMPPVCATARGDEDALGVR